MTKFFDKRIIILSSILFFVGISLFVSAPKFAEAGTDSSLIGYYQCDVHGHNDELDCSTDIVLFPNPYAPRSDYTSATMDYQFARHRHGSSYVNATVCLVDSNLSGPCQQYNCSGNSCGTEYGGQHPFPVIASGTLSKSVPSGSAFYVIRDGSVMDAEVRVYAQGTATYPDAIPVTCIDPSALNYGEEGECQYPPGSTTSNVNFHVQSNCSAENIQGANVNIGTSSGVTNSSGDINFVVTADTAVNWSASAVGYSSGSGMTNSGPAGGTIPVNVTLDRDCFEPPIPPPPPEEPAPPLCTADDDATVTWVTPPPSSMTVNQTYNFTVRAQNTGNTKWWPYYGNSGYKLSQLSTQNIVSVAPSAYEGFAYGHLGNAIGVIWPSDYVDWTFNIVAPSVPGNYSLDMRMIHEEVLNEPVGLWGYKLASDDSDGGCPIPTETFGFGNTASDNFTVVSALPTLTGSSTISSSSVSADGTTPYTITATGINSSGAGNILTIQSLINYQGGNAGAYRGYLMWNTSGGSVSCTGAGGTGSVNAAYGAEYISLESCSSANSGNSKIISFVVKFQPAFTTPTTGNDISTYVHDLPTGTSNGWQNSDTNFSLIPPSAGLAVNSVTINDSTVVANNSNQYTITVAASDPAGGANITQEYALINFQGADSGQYRGWLTWGASNWWPSDKDSRACTGGGGYAAIQSTGGNSIYGHTYLQLDACSTSVSGNTRTTVFTVRFSPDFATDGPQTGNDISGYAINSGGSADGWDNFPDLFGLNATMSGTLIPATPSCQIAEGSSNCNINFTWTTTNPVGTPGGVYSETNNSGASSPSFLVALGNDGGPTPFSVPYINNGSHTSRNFYLYNSGIPLATSAVIANCGPGLVWTSTGDMCVTASSLAVNSVTINDSTVVANNSNQYTITVAASDPAGGANINQEFAFINYQGADAGQYRGYLTWGASNWWPSDKDSRACTGGGYAAIQSTGGNSIYGHTYLQLDACSTSVSGNTRTTVFTVRFSPDFATDGPQTGNDISGYAINSGGSADGWDNFPDLFGLVGGPPTCSSAGPDDVTVIGDNHDVYMYGVNNATSTLLEIWSNVGGSDDYSYSYGSDLGGGTWILPIDLTNQTPPGNTDYGAFTARTSMGNATSGWIVCDTANFTRIANAGTGDCSDGIQNGDETSIDTGGRCGTGNCFDNQQNGDETGIDTGGRCTPGAGNCSDGIQNGDETSIDTGGRCGIGNCFDGQQNGDETGIDTGGRCSVCTNGAINPPFCTQFVKKPFFIER